METEEKWYAYMEQKIESQRDIGKMFFYLAFLLFIGVTKILGTGEMKNNLYGVYSFRIIGLFSIIGILFLVGSARSSIKLDPYRSEETLFSYHLGMLMDFIGNLWHKNEEEFRIEV